MRGRGRVARPEPAGPVPAAPGRVRPALADPPFALLDTDDAARAFVEALGRDVDGPYNVVGPGAASPWQAVRRGGRVPVPVAGPGWRLAGRVAEVAGAPVPPHVLELLRRGRVADGGRAVTDLGLADLRPTQCVLDDLFEWATVTRLEPAGTAVVA